MIDVYNIAIGNWVYDGDKTQFPMRVEGLGRDYVYLDFDGNEGDLWETTPEELQGIPLTEELLTKAGFVNRDGLWRKNEKKRDILININREFVFIEAFDNKYLDSRGWCHQIKYLHQLQNFFRNISKENLDIIL